MFEAKLGSAATMKKIVDAIKDLLDDANFDCSEAGISLQAMDSSHVALVSLRLDSAGFETYRCDRSTNLGIKLAHFAKIVKCAGNDDSLKLSFQDDGDTIGINFENAAQDRLSEYNLKLMDLDAEHLGIPDQDYAAVITMPASEFQRICRDLAQFGDSLQIEASKGDVTFMANGDVGSAKVRLSASASADEDEARVDLKVSEHVKINFAVKYLNHFTKATGLSQKVTLKMSNDVPIVVEYMVSVAGMDMDEDEKDSKRRSKAPKEDIGYIRYYLAPKIDDTDDNMN